MSWLILLLAFYIVLLLTICASFLIKRQKGSLHHHLPYISVLLAVRNEKENILRCVTALKALDYPHDRIEFLIGDDDSSDNTAEIVSAAIADDPRFQFFHIIERWGKARGKANVLAQLARKARGSYFFITDADIQVNPSWIHSILSLFSAKTGIVSGFTVVRPMSFLTKLQSLDWLYYMGLLVSFNRMKMDCTAVGNNMAVRREAYEGTGGYENIEFSVTEDLQLFKEIKKAGWGNINTDEAGTLAWSQPVLSVRSYLHQRKRWIQGGSGLPFFWKAILASIVIFYLLLLILALHDIKIALAFWGIKIVLQGIILNLNNNRIGRALKINPAEIFLFEIYLIISTFSSGFFFLLPIKMTWKERTY